jgi:hypothetical protein
MDLEKENTFRILREQDLLISSKWCIFGFHKWTKWRIQSHGSIPINYSPRRILYIFEKKCINCNYIKRERRHLLEETVINK